MNNDLSLNDADEARLDRAIDRAVRDMMQLDPPPGLRRRVLSRLNQSGERRRHWLPRFAFAAAAAVVVLLSATEMWYRRDAPTPPKPPDMATMTAPRANDQATMRNEFDGPSIPGGQITKELIRMPRVTNVFGTRRDDATAATVRGAEPARPRVLENLAPLTIVPLSARPIVIEPLSIPALPKGGPQVFTSPRLRP